MSFHLIDNEDSMLMMKGPLMDIEEVYKLNEFEIEEQKFDTLVKVCESYGLKCHHEIAWICHVFIQPKDEEDDFQNYSILHQREIYKDLQKIKNFIGGKGKPALLLGKGVKVTNERLIAKMIEAVMPPEGYLESELIQKIIRTNSFPQADRMYLSVIVRKVYDFLIKYEHLKSKNDLFEVIGILLGLSGWLITDSNGDVLNDYENVYRKDLIQHIKSIRKSYRQGLE